MKNLETHITVKSAGQSYKLSLTFDIQTAPSGRPIRHSGVRKNTQKPQEWIDGMYRSWLIYTFRYMDDESGFVSFEFNPRGEFVGKC